MSDGQVPQANTRSFLSVKRDEALTKRCKYEDLIDLKVSLRADRATSVIDFGRLMLGIMWVRFDASHLPPPQLEVIEKHAAAGARRRSLCDVISSSTASKLRLDMAFSAFKAWRYYPG